MGLAATGIPTEQELAQVLPSPERLARRRVAIVECFQEIPCDPCSEACPFGAIKPFTDINARPNVVSDDCVGCGLCVARCPGLAIFLVDLNYTPEVDLEALPHEFLPVPAIGQRVAGLDRAGEEVCAARVAMVQNHPSQDRTLIVWLEVPRGLGLTVRALAVREPKSANACQQALAAGVKAASGGEGQR